MKFYKVYLGGSYIAGVIEADTKEEAYDKLDDEDFYLLTPCEYDHWFG